MSEADYLNYTGHNYLDLMFDLQQTLMVELVKNNKLEPFPVDIDSQEGQALVRLYTDFGITELSESWEQFVELVELRNADPRGFNVAKIEEAHKKFNHELADSLAFFLEVFVLMGMDGSTVTWYVERVIETAELRDSFQGPNTLHNLFGYVSSINFKDGYKTLNIKPRLYKADQSTLQYNAGLSVVLDPVFKEKLWEVTYAYKRAINSLKSKPWKKTTPAPKPEILIDLFMEAFLQLISAYELFGWNYYSCYQNFVTVNINNIKRIKERY